MRLPNLSVGSKTNPTPSCRTRARKLICSVMKLNYRHTQITKQALHCWCWHELLLYDGTSHSRQVQPAAMTAGVGVFVQIFRKVRKNIYILLANNMVRTFASPRNTTAQSVAACSSRKLGTARHDANPSMDGYLSNSACSRKLQLGI